MITFEKVNKWLGPLHVLHDLDFSVVENEVVRELEEKRGMTDFRKRFNLLRFYTVDQIIEFYRRDIAERTTFLRELFAGQEGEEALQPVIEVWERREIPNREVIKAFYEEHYGRVDGGDSHTIA